LLKPTTDGTMLRQVFETADVFYREMGFGQ
jgi:hypothetical protein